MKHAQAKLYLFDIDGTLLLTGGAGRRALERIFLERYGIAGAMEGIRPGGMTDPLIVEEMFARIGRDPDDMAAVLAAYEEALAIEVPLSASFRLLPSARELCEALRERGAHLALATGNTARGAQIKLEHAKLWHLFACGGFGSDSRDRTALVRVAIDRACAAAGDKIPLEDILVVGDTPRDIAAARAAGVRVAAVATGGHDLEELATFDPDELYPSLTAILDQIA